jgi:hypothetical protein
MAAALGVPALANVFYYGKEFGTKKEKVNEKGQLVEEPYKPLSVTKAGAEGDEADYTASDLPVAKSRQKSENSDDPVSKLLSGASNSVSMDDILKIVRGE